MSRPPASLLVALLFAVTIAGFSTWRLFHGVGFSDEAFYVAMPYTFALGNQPFVNELAIQQTAALIVTPFARAFVSLRGAEGIVLAFRGLFLLVALVTGAAIFRFTRAVAGTAEGLILSVLPLAIVPGIPSVSYNTLGMNFLCAGACLAAHGVLRRNRTSLLLAGPALILAAFAYPTLLVPGAVSVFMAAVWLARQGLRTEWRFLMYGWLAAVVLAFAYTASLGWENLATSLHYMLRHARHVGAGGKVEALWSELLTSAPYEPWKLSLLAAAAAATVFARKWNWIGLATMVVVLASFRDAADWRIVATVTIYGALFLAPVATVATWKGCGAPVAAIAILPGLVAAFITAWTSSNGFPNGTIGAGTALAVALALAMGAAPVEGRGWLQAAAMFFLAAAMWSTLHFVYADGPLSQLTARVAAGPYAGLYTTPERLDFVTQLAEDVARHAKGKKTLFYDSFPAGYLFVDTAPRIEATWIPSAVDFPSFDRTWYTSYFAQPVNRPDVVFEIMGVPGGDGTVQPTRATRADPMRYGFRRSGYRLVEDHRHYAIYESCDSCVTDVLEGESLLRPTDAPTWVRLPGEVSEGAMAGTSRQGATLRGTIPRFEPGAYRVDLYHYRNRPRIHELRVQAGEYQRPIKVAATAPYGVSGVVGATFPDVRTADFSIEVMSAGKGALLLDQVVFSRAGSVELLVVSSEHCEVGPLTLRAVTFEPESVVRREHGSLEDRKLVSREWIRIRRASYSGGGAAMTSAAGAALQGRAEGIQPGNYSVSVRFVHPGPGFEAAARVTLGEVTREFHADPSQPRGVHETTALLFPGVRNDRLTITSVVPGRPSLMIDAVTIREVESP